MTFGFPKIRLRGRAPVCLAARSARLGLNVPVDTLLFVRKLTL